MQNDPVDDILHHLATGQLTPSQAREQLQACGAESLGYATLDHHRATRCGVPEVIYAAGKTPTQVVDIAQALLKKNTYALITRAMPDHADAVHAAFNTVRSGNRRQTLLIGSPPPPVEAPPIPIITAGTSDEAVAEEAELTCLSLGQPTHRISDVGVAGIHRLTRRLAEIRDSNVIICIAGMEGALPSVMGGLVDVPIIAVPTSVGYGAAFSGIAALCSMLTSCAAGITVVNIDNGFGAAYAATLIQRRCLLAARKSTEKVR